MFKKLKDKIAEEVKQSPQRFQQMAQAAQNAVSSASSTTSEISGSDNFFSLTEEDTPQNSPVKKQQQPNSNSNISLNNIPNNKHIGNNNGVPLANRSRRLSNSSVASDVSFRLPTFDSPAAYHLQSDLDVSASEVEDSGLSVNNQLELISKEQLHSAYRRALDRYQKYRERYTDLAKRYRDLEKDNTKARAVLVETQDKALRRISELREQCSLEQQAKAHLEAALRLEMDEMQYVVQSLKSKLELVNEQNEKDKISKKTETDNLINLDAEHMPNGETDSISKENIAKLEQMLDDYKLQIEEEKSKLIIQKEATVKQEAQFNEMKTKLTEYENKISELQKREEENILLIAENKLSIHSELENKDLEVKNIKEKLFALEKDAKQSATEKAALQEKINQLNQKLNNENKNKEQQKELESKIKTVNEEKLKLESKFVDFEKTILNLENENSNFKLNIKKFEDSKNNSHIKEEEMQELIKQHKENYSKVTKENDNLQEQLTNKLREMEELTNLNMLMKSECQKQLEDKTEIEEKLKQVFDEKEKVNTELKQIKDKVEKVNNKFKKLSDEKLSLQSQNDQLHGEMKRCKEEINNLLQQKSNLTEEIKNSKIINENTESEAIKSLQESMKTSISQLEQKLSEKSLEMDEAVTKNVNEIKTLTETNQELTENLQNSEKIKNEKIEEIQTAKQKIESLRNEKKDLEKTLEREIREKTELKTQVTNIIQEIGRLEEQLKEVKDSYTQIQTEKQTLEEKFEKVQKHHNETKNKLEKESTHKLNNKLKEFETKLHEIQSENSQLADSNCLLEENIRRTTEDLKKQQSSNTDLENQFKQEKNSLNEKIKEIRDKYNQSEDKIKNLNDQLSQCTGDHAKLFNEKELLEHQHRSLQDALEAKEKEKLCVLDTNKCLQDELALVKENLNVANASIECLENEKMELIKSVDNLSEYREKMQIDNKNLIAQLNASETKLNDKMNNELENLRLQLANKEKECADLIQAQNVLQKALEEVKLKSELNDIELSELKEKLSLTEIQLAELQKEKDHLIESNDCLNKEIGFLNNKSQHRLNELENLLKHTNDEKQTLKDSINKNQTDIEKKLENYEELKIENEYLNTLTKQLESEKSKFESNISQLNDKDKQREKEIADLKIRINQNEKMLEEKDSEIKKLINEFVELEKANVGKQQDEINKNQKLNTDLTSLQQTLAERNEEITKLQKEIANQVIIINDLNKDYDSVNQKFEKATGEINVLNETVEKLKENAVTQDKSNVLELENSQLNESISELKIKLESEQESNETKLRDLASERLQLLDKLKVDSDNSKLEYEKLRVELDKVKQENIDLQEKQQANIDSETVDPESMQELKSKNDDLEVQLKKIMHEVQDVSNRNLFLEQKCENYLILEQSNERLKLTNDKLSRQLDETLVSMHHNEGLSANTEFEYLKNILFQYLSGNIGNNNNSPLVKVIAAVLKFTPQQTQLVIEKEAQRHTLMGQLNNLL